ncbi:nitroreductase family protein [Lachnotalea glycerini]|uniref:Nitroreductase n=1 Tax=Lachnotalea glycerini TaxID=1763509 RepID=A0A371JD25_9FIRM|nr:nitroreductase family protein [Lachnotalea glycerini]RDY30669.1 nitroreductase [Lachnotalea glycerini]
MTKNFQDAIKARRSYYGISKEKVTSDERIEEIVRESVKYTPSAFNSQSARAILLLQGQHDSFWDITMEALRKVVPEAAFANTEEKINSFKNGYGTVLYFEDQITVKSLQEQFAPYKDNFPVWSQQSSAMLQLVIWTALEEEGFGASLQHYTELIEAEIKKEWNIPKDWKMIAQMPFGKPNVQPDEKQFNIQEEHIKVYK